MPFFGIKNRNVMRWVLAYDIAIEMNVGFYFVVTHLAPLLLVFQNSLRAAFSSGVTSTVN